MGWGWDAASLLAPCKGGRRVRRGCAAREARLLVGFAGKGGRGTGGRSCGDRQVQSRGRRVGPPCGVEAATHWPAALSLFGPERHRHRHAHTRMHTEIHAHTHTYIHTPTHLHIYTQTHRHTDTNTLHSHARLGRTAMAAVRAPSPSFLSAFLPVARATLFPDAAPIIRRPPLLHTLRTSLLPAVLVPLPALLGDLWDGLLNAVPKKKTSHMKKRHRQMAGKALKDVTALNKCSACGRVKRAHVLCPYCVQSRSRPCALRR